jgi:hypothetical protein
MRSVPTGASLSACVLAVAAAGTGTGIALGGGSEGSGIKGLVVPCGIVLERPAPCATSAAHTSVVVGQGKRVVRTANVRNRGRFRVPLAAGRYWLRTRAGKVPGPRARATVPEGEWTTVTIPAGQVSPPAATGRR